MEKFKQNLLTILEDLCRDNGTKVTTIDIVKHNDISRKAICLTPADSSVGTNYYVDDLLKQYEAGSTLMEIASNILEHNRSTPLFADTSLINPFISNLSSYDYVKENLSVRLLNLSVNSKYLSDKVYKPYLEMNGSYEFAISLCIYVPESKDEHGIITVTHRLREMWTNVTDEELFEIALQNTEKNCGCRIRTMLEVLTNLAEEADVIEALDNISKEPTMYVMTNNHSLHGASCILYTDALKQFADEKECNLFIIPSSIHEMLLILDDKTVDINQLKEIISDVNRTAVSKSDFLSNELLYYSRSKNEISICKTRMRD